MLYAQNYQSSKKKEEAWTELLNGGGQRRSYLRIGATFAVAAIALIAGGQPNEARAADGTTDVTVQVAEGDENLAWSVPTQIPMKATAAGTLIGPDADAIAIRNLSAFPIRVKQMDTTAEAPFNLVDDVDKSSGNNDFMMTVNGAAAKQTVELSDDGTWAMGYAGNEKGNDKLPITISDAKIARVTTNLSAAKKAATVTWTVEPTAKGINQPGATEPGGSDIIQAAVAKDAKDWTLGEQKAVAEDIAAKGEASPAYVKAKAAMDAETTWSMQLTDGSTLEYRIIGINHDDLADGSGKAGLTFLTYLPNAIGGIHSEMNATETNAGGWEASELRAKMNGGEIWNLMPSNFQSKVKSVKKLTNNVGGGDKNKNAVVTATTDKLFLLSYSEIVPTSYWVSDYPWTSSEGTQYEAFKDKVTSNAGSNFGFSCGTDWWERSVYPHSSMNFCLVSCTGDPASSSYHATGEYFVCPAWCF